MKTATFIERLPRWSGDARKYRLSEPLDGHDYVIVSAVYAPFSGPETYIFPAREKGGDAINYLELAGSFKGGLDHTKALSLAGYQVVNK